MSKKVVDKQKTNDELDKTDAQALLEAANSASERVASLHTAFMAVCAYVLVIVFGTTDLDLLIGKGVKLPVVNVDVPIVGFYALAPYIVVLVHLNLLLQLQLLSRKLFAFDAAAPQEKNIGGLRDRLHIFPYTYYLVGRPSPLVHALVGLMVSITLVLLPFLTLLALQLQFLAYQNEATTWWQRAAIWLDLALIIMLWPTILHRRDDWRDYWREIIAAYITRRRTWAVFVLLIIGLFLFLFAAGKGLFFAGLGFLILSPLAVIFIYGFKNISHMRKAVLFISFVGSLAATVAVAYGRTDFRVFEDFRIIILIGYLLIVPLVVLWHPQAPRGSLALLFTLLIGPMIPAALVIDGERWEQFVLRVQGSPSIATQISQLFLDDKRRLTIDEQVLATKSLKPEMLALVRSGKSPVATAQIEPVNLRGRNLRHSFMSGVILIGADLSNAQLQGAQWWGAKLQGANLSSAQLQGAGLLNAQFQGADLSFAELQGADLLNAQLQGAFLMGAKLQGTDLLNANFQGANLYGAQLQGANMLNAKLQGADLESAKLHGAILRNAKLYSFEPRKWQASLVDAEEATWAPLSDIELSELTTELQTVISSPRFLDEALIRLEAAAQPGAQKVELDSCFATADTPLICRKHFNPAKPDESKDFTLQLNVYLGQLACESPEIARGLMWQVSSPLGFRKEGLRSGLEKLLDNKKCEGLQNLSAEEKSKLRAMQ